MYRSIFRTLSILLGLVPALSACERIPTEAKEIAGEYRLTAINGVMLPTTVTTGGGKTAQVLEGSLQLQRDGKYLQVIHYGAPGGASNPHDTGRYRVQGSSLRFASADRAVYVGRVGAGILTISFDLSDADPAFEELTFSRN